MLIKSKSTIHGLLLKHYYRWMFRNELAEDICTLFWSIVASIPLLPLTVPAYVASLVFGSEIWDKSLLGKAFNGLLTYFGVVIGLSFGFGAFVKTFGTVWREWGFWKIIGAALLGLIGIAVALFLVVGVIGGIGYGISKLIQWLERRNQVKMYYDTVDEYGNLYHDFYYESKSKEPSKIGEIWGAIRKKYCTKITWE